MVTPYLYPLVFFFFFFDDSRRIDLFQNHHDSSTLSIPSTIIYLSNFLLIYRIHITLDIRGINLPDSYVLLQRHSYLIKPVMTFLSTLFDIRLFFFFPFKLKRPKLINLFRFLVQNMQHALSNSACLVIRVTTRPKPLLQSHFS